MSSRREITIILDSITVAYPGFLIGEAPKILRPSFSKIPDDLFCSSLFPFRLYSTFAYKETLPITLINYIITTSSYNFSGLLRNVFGQCGIREATAGFWTIFRDFLDCAGLREGHGLPGLPWLHYCSIIVDYMCHRLVCNKRV